VLHTAASNIWGPNTRTNIFSLFCFLSAVSVTAVAYSDAMARVGSMAKLCKGGTEEIGKFSFIV